jgi:tetratricopeptide (TPR) repeat protein
MAAQAGSLMSARSDDGQRNLVPRWRYTNRTPLTGEHNGDPSRPLVAAGKSLHLAAAEALWRSSPSIEHAVELISCACASGKPLLAQSAAASLRSSRVRVPEPLSVAIDWILTGAPSNEHVWAAADASNLAGLAEAKQKIKSNRAALIEGPRNVAGWLDLSLAHCVLGRARDARRAMTVALGLAPNHRAVLRAAARMLVHLGQTDEAHALIRRHPRTPTEPWLMATEISIAQVLGQMPLFTAKGRRFARDHSHQPAYVTELAGAVATAENAAGEHRRAHKLYQLSLQEPTDNVVAQIQYLSQSDRSLKYGNRGLDLPSAVEARTWQAMGQDQWDIALKEALGWQADEPFSSRPPTAVSYLAMIVGEPLLAASSAEAGLCANEGDQLLRNNLAVAYARAGRHEDALREFRKLRAPLQRGYPNYVFEATCGLMAYIAGDATRGRELYEAATRHAPVGDRPLVAISWVETEWTFEPTSRPPLLMELRQAIDKTISPAVRAVARRLVSAPPEKKVAAGPQLNSSQLAITRGLIGAQPPVLKAVGFPDGESAS